MVINSNVGFNDALELKYKYTGYLKIAGHITPGIGAVVIDDQSYRPTEEGTFYYEGHVKETIGFVDSELGVTFTEFSTNPYELSQDTRDFYSNIPEGNEDAWGELTVKNLELIKGKKFNWHELKENVSFDKMEFWNNDYVTEVPNLSSGFIIDPDSSDNFQPSGYKNLYITRSSNILPILIHKNDIGKKNTIGPLLQEDGSEIYINLTII